MTDLHELTASQIAAAVQSRKLSPVDVARALVERIDRLEPSVRAWEAVEPERVMDAARASEQRVMAGKMGALEGVPVGLKDIYFTADLPTTMSSKVYRDFRPDHDATSVAAMRAAGAVILGKTVTTEFATGDPSRTRNPWNLEHTPGGSSSGSAAAVAARMCPAATGSQTAGSVCRPASYNGVVGLKPTGGRVSRFGVFPVSWTLDTLGWMTRDVRDSALLLDVLSGFDERDPASRHSPPERAVDAVHRADDGLRPRIGVVGGFFDEMSTPEVAARTRDVADRLSTVGARVEPFDLPESFRGIHEAQVVIDYSECAVVHRETFMRSPDDYSPNIRSRIEAGCLMPASAYLRAQRLRRRFRLDMQRMLEGFDAILMPSTPTPAGDLSSTGDPMFQAPWTAAGLPEITLPIGLSESGLPLGVQLVARAWDDANLLRTAAWAEGVLNVRLGTPSAV